MMRIFGIWLPWIGVRELPANRDGSIFDTGKADILDEEAPYYFPVFAFEWFGYGFSIWPFAELHDSRTRKPVEEKRF